MASFGICLLYKKRINQEILTFPLLTKMKQIHLLCKIIKKKNLYRFRFHKNNLNSLGTIYLDTQFVSTCEHKHTCTGTHTHTLKNLYSIFFIYFLYFIITCNKITKNIQVLLLPGLFSVCTLAPFCNRRSITVN